METEGLIGFFVNQLVLRIDLSGDPSLRAILHRVRDTTLGAYAHQDTPFEKLVEELAPERDLARAPLCQVSFIFQNAPRSSAKLADLALSPFGRSIGVVRIDVEIVLLEIKDRIFGDINYDVDLFDAVTVARFAQHFMQVADELVNRPEKRISELSMLTPQEEWQLIGEWNDTQADCPEKTSFVELFEAQAERSPEAVAVSFGDQLLTYGELNRRANVVARLLCEQGVAPEVTVGVLANRDINLLISLIAIFKTDGVYVPLDPLYPVERLRQVLSLSNTHVILASYDQVEKVEALLDNESSGEAAVILNVDELLQPASQVEPVRPRCEPSNLAYVIFTSGSTGTPKGAMIQHGGMLNHLFAKVASLSLNEKDIIAQTASQSFDISIWQLLAALLVGGRVHIVGDESGRDPSQLLREASSNNVLILEVVPSMLAAMLDELERDRSRDRELWGLRSLVVTGEALPPELCRRWLGKYPHIPLVNAYGPTECSDDVTQQLIETIPDAKTFSMPIGRPLINTRTYVVSSRGLQSPAGVEGELYVGGAGVGRGYFNDSAQTAANFVPDHYGTNPGARLYRTGDRAKHRHDGRIEFLGRMDHQVKVRGYRIELGEIEEALLSHPKVEIAAAVVRTDAKGDQIIFGYAAARDGAQLAVTELQSFLRERIPEYMIPSAFVMLDSLPLTPNGKVDRKALPVPDVAETSGESDQVRTPVEEILAGIWADVLRLKEVNINQNFFDLGGHSLLATQVVSRVRRVLNLDIPLRLLFESPTISSFARSLDQLRKAGRVWEAPPIRPVSRDQMLPLSYAQQRLWLMQQLDPRSAAYNITNSLRVRGALNLAAVRMSLQEIARRHEVLRTRFEVREGMAVQVIEEAREVEIGEWDVSESEPRQREERAREIARQEGGRAMDLEAGPLWRVGVVKMGEEDHVLMMSMHHVVSDGWSMGVMIKEFTALYEGYRQGREEKLEEMVIQYADYAVWQREWLRGEVLEEEVGYWRKQLGGMRVEAMGTDRERPVVASQKGGKVGIRIGEEMSKGLKEMSRREGVTIFMLLLAAFKIVLARYTGRYDVVVGTDVANRNMLETEGLIGFFVNQLVLRTDLSGNPSFTELLRRVRETTLGAYDHQDLPFNKLVEELQPSRSLSHNPMFQVLFLVENREIETTQWTGVTVTPWSLGDPASKFDWVVIMRDTETEISGSWLYQTELFDVSTIERECLHFEKVLKMILASPDARLSELGITTEEPEKLSERARRRRQLGQAKPKMVRLPVGELVNIEHFTPGQTLPLVVVPAVEGLDLPKWAGAQREFIETCLLKDGAVLFRGFNVEGLGEFERFASAVCPELFSEYGDLPREQMGGRVYGSTPYPNDRPILFHNESSHMHCWPLKIWFHCVLAPEQGGESPLVDCRELFRDMNPEMRSKFLDKGLMYVRNFGNNLDVSWQDFFRTSDRAAVEEFCRKASIACEWVGDEILRTKRVCRAAAKHPKTGEQVFFNQLQAHHISCLTPERQGSVIRAVRRRRAAQKHLLRRRREDP